MGMGVRSRKLRGVLGAKILFGNELLGEVGEGALGKGGAGGSQEKGADPPGWCGMGEGTIKGGGCNHGADREWSVGMRNGVMCQERMYRYTGI